MKTLIKILYGVFLTFSIIAFTKAYDNESLVAANYLASKGIINNHQTNPALYNLDNTILRQELAAIVRGIAGLPKKATCDNEFKDVSATKPNSWACYTVEALRDASIIAKNPYFNPERQVTKAEALGMLIKASGLPYNYNSSLGKRWEEQVSDFAYKNGLLKRQIKDYTTFATRGWIFKIAKRIFDKIESDSNQNLDEINEILDTLFNEVSK